MKIDVQALTEVSKSVISDPRIGKAIDISKEVQTVIIDGLEYELRVQLKLRDTRKWKPYMELDFL
jgi:hypothetical protein